MEKSLVVTLLLAGQAFHSNTHMYALPVHLEGSYCREKHTDLVTVHSLEEQQQLQNIVKNEASDFKKETNNRFWIGLYRDSENWQWSTGDAVRYTKWTAETSNITERYTLISTLKTWPDAQQYCRQHHADLVSIKSTSENEDIKKKAPASPFWIGLFNNPWKWTDEENSTFQKWDIGEPDNMLGNENCTMMYHTQGQWRDAPCSQRYFFFCYEETSNITERYTLISTLKTWPDAQQYCRQHHADLVSIKSTSENEDIKKKAPASPFWIGLFNNPWKWTDEENSTFQKWDIGEPDNMLGNENCTMMYHTQGQWRDAPCSQRYFFFCYEGTFSRCSECHGNAVCQSSSESVQCVCAEGFVGDGFSCYNRTECNETTDCCPHGFQWSKEHGCTDIDECAADGDLSDCPPQSSCVNTIGSFHCLLDHISKRSSRSVSFSCINQPCPSGQDCITDSCVDPCQQYNVLAEPWRSTHFPIAPSSDPKCDSGLNGWYRFLVNDSVRMPEKCVPDYSCGTDATLWINGTHPVETDGILQERLPKGMTLRWRKKDGKIFHKQEEEEEEKDMETCSKP
ncbi:UNVERIFIED_CONTAM: hypothetical protein FKN15_003712 [Acipenser sinensis]